MDFLLPKIETALLSAGLYPEEARAMLESWKDFWFEEGSRLIYVVPNSFVEKILPLSIQPQPAKIQRVFVGRMELLTPTTRSAIETAVAGRDKAALAKYGRFVAPIIEMILGRNPAVFHSAELSQELNGIYQSYIAQNVALAARKTQLP